MPLESVRSPRRRSGVARRRWIDRGASLCVAFAMGVVSSLASRDALADPKDAKIEAAELFKRGAEAYAHGDFDAAASAFEASYRLIPRASAIYDAALAREALGESARAADDYAIALDKTDLHGAEAAEARKHLEALAKTLGVLEVAAPAGARVAVDHEPSAAPPIRVHVVPGAHEVRIEYANGGSSARDVVVREGLTASVTFDAPPAPVSPIAPVAQSPSPLPPPQSPPPHEGGDRRRTYAWIGGGAALVFAGAAVGLGLETLHARTVFDDSADRDAGAHDRAITFRALTNVAWGLAAATAVTSVVLFATAPANKKARGARSWELRAALGGGAWRASF